MDDQLRPLRSPEVLRTTLDSGAALAARDDGHTWTLDSVGLFVWDRCNGEDTVGHIVHALAVESGIEEDTARRDVETFLLELESCGLVTLCAPPTS